MRRTILQRAEHLTPMRSRQIQNTFYHLRLMAALAVSLVLVTLCFKLPLRFDPAPEPWRLTLIPQGIRTGMEQPLFLTPVTDGKFIGSPPGTDAFASAADQIIIPKDTIPEYIRPALRQTSAVPILDRAEIMPEIRGGLGAYYIMIDYPKEAIDQGIEGKLVMTFTVNPDGGASDILVSQSLHALLDSAAVQALRRTRFIPGQHMGKSARVRMRLPVRFQLIDPTDSTLTQASSPEQAPKQ